MVMVIIEVTFQDNPHLLAFTRKKTHQQSFPHTTSIISYQYTQSAIRPQ